MKRAYSLVELLIVMSILAILSMMLVGILNPRVLVDKAFDARRKKDINRIKVAFEEYINDTGCYPPQALVNGLACNGSGFSQWGLNSWPCDPVTRLPYYVFSEPVNCSSWYKILTNLGNKSDPQIPVGWYAVPNTQYVLSGNLTLDKANYGVSSPNVLWYDIVLDPICYQAVKGCYLPQASGGGFDVNYNQEVCDAYLAPDYVCRVKCCFNGNICSDSSICP